MPKHLEVVTDFEAPVYNRHRAMIEAVVNADGQFVAIDPTTLTGVSPVNRKSAIYAAFANQDLKVSVTSRDSFFYVRLRK